MKKISLLAIGILPLLLMVGCQIKERPDRSEVVLMPNFAQTSGYISFDEGSTTLSAKAEERIKALIEEVSKLQAEDYLVILSVVGFASLEEFEGSKIGPPEYYAFQRACAAEDFIRTLIAEKEKEGQKIPCIIINTREWALYPNYSEMKIKGRMALVGINTYKVIK